MSAKVEVTLDRSRALLGHADTHSVFVSGKGYLTNLDEKEAAELVKHLSNQLKKDNPADDEKP